MLSSARRRGARPRRAVDRPTACSCCTGHRALPRAARARTTRVLSAADARPSTATCSAGSTTPAIRDALFTSPLAALAADAARRRRGRARRGPVVRVGAGARHGEPVAPGRAVLQHRSRVRHDVGRPRRRPGRRRAPRRAGFTPLGPHVRAGRVRRRRADAASTRRRLEHRCPTTSTRRREVSWDVAPATPSPCTRGRSTAPGATGIRPSVPAPVDPLGRGDRPLRRPRPAGRRSGRRSRTACRPATCWRAPDVPAHRSQFCVRTLRTDWPD